METYGAGKPHYSENGILPARQNPADYARLNREIVGTIVHYHFGYGSRHLAMSFVDGLGKAARLAINSALNAMERMIREENTGRRDISEVQKVKCL